jgi:hypothetical protein
MKRLLWLACIGCCSSMALIACGDDDDGGGSSEDGGVSNFDEVTDRLGEIDNTIADLGTDVDMKLDGVNADIGEANDSIGDLEDTATDLETRLGAVEDDLEVVNCSVDEACMPDGIMVSETGIKSIVTQLCTLEINCCDANELTYKFGPGITKVDECTATFTDLVNNGFSPDFLSGNGVLINRVINMAQAINSNDVQVTIDADAVKACVDYLSKRECNKYVAPDAEPLLHCTPPTIEDVADPCALKLLVKGAQMEGDVCGITGVDECSPGLTCRKTGAGSQLGLCHAPSKVGERCRRDADCDGTEQFCNLTTGMCQERSAEGEDCEYVDPTFKNDIGGLDPGYGYGPSGQWQNPTALKIECKQGLTCDPTTNKCVSFCSQGAICFTNAGCPDGLICNFTEIANMYMTFGYGICTAAIGKDDPCTLTNGVECMSGRCAFDGVTDARNECADPFKAAGEACTLITAGVSNADPTCATGRCGTDGKCVEVCLEQVDCPAGDYCSSESATGGNACEPKKANDVACSALTIPTNTNDNFECASGFCQAGGVNLCKAKVAAGGACGTGQDTACMASQYCKFDSGAMTYTCTAIVTPGNACTLNNECGAGAYCGVAGSNVNKCVAFAASGATCDATNDLRCNDAASLVCADFGATDRCYEPGHYAVGAVCTGGAQQDSMGTYRSFDTICESTWCRLSDGTCQAPIAAGGDCDDDNPAKDRCATGTYCKFPALAITASAYGEGKCTAQGTAGQPCDPRFGGDDCVDPGNCELRNDAFVCSVASVVAETLFCDGE